MVAFGPIPSRRLGYSLGINNIFPKYCSYACVYCQVGRTDHLQITRQSFYTPAAIYRDVHRQVARVFSRHGKIDFLSFVPDGEPTLDVNLGETIRKLKQLGIPVAVFTNCSLLWMEAVRRDLCEADWVSLKVDTLDDNIWRRLNRPYGRLSLQQVLAGVMQFRNEFSGTLATETMLVWEVNTFRNMLLRTAKFLELVDPEYAYLSTPTRPPAETWVAKPPLQHIYSAYRIFRQHLRHVELLLIERENDYSATGSAEEDLLRTTAVQPMTEDAVREVLARNNADWKLVEQLIRDNVLGETIHDGRRFIVRRRQRRKSKTL